MGGEREERERDKSRAKGQIFIGKTKSIEQTPMKSYEQGKKPKTNIYMDLYVNIYYMCVWGNQGKPQREGTLINCKPFLVELENVFTWTRFCHVMKWILQKLKIKKKVKERKLPCEIGTKLGLHVTNLQQGKERNRRINMMH